MIYCRKDQSASVLEIDHMGQIVRKETSENTSVTQENGCGGLNKDKRELVRSGWILNTW